VAPESYAANPEAAAPIKIPVVAPSATSGVLRNEVTVTGGGASGAGDALTVEETPVGTERPPFEVANFGFGATAVGGGPSTQAGGHPGDVTASLKFSSFMKPTEEDFQASREWPVLPVESPRSASVELPLGFLGDPRATPTCSEAQMLIPSSFGRDCPPESRVGIATLDTGGHLFLTGGVVGTSESDIYNVTPQHGYPAEFGFSIVNNIIIVYASVVHTDAGYRLRVSAPGIPAALGFDGASMTFFGDPAAENGSSGAHVPFLMNPVDCSAGPLSAKVEADSWEDPGRWVSKEATTYSRMTGCNLLRFNPSFELKPSTENPSEGGTTQADAPSGYNFNLKVPQTEAFSELATPELKDATVTLPEGVSVSPAAADGLEGCQETGPRGINISGPESEEVGADGLEHTSRGKCPDGSTLGGVEVATPLLLEISKETSFSLSLSVAGKVRRHARKRTQRTVISLGSISKRRAPVSSSSSRAKSRQTRKQDSCRRHSMKTRSSRSAN